MIFASLGFSAESQKKSDWTYVCPKEGTIKICYIEQQLFLQKKIDGKDKTVGRLLHALIHKTKLKSGKSAFRLNLWLPLGTNLKTGAKILIDQKNETELTFHQCTNRGCLMIADINNKYIKSLQRGKTLNIAWLPYGTAKTFIANVSLNGFTKELKKLK